MGLICCDKCWERPCVCGHEAKEKAMAQKQYLLTHCRTCGTELKGGWCPECSLAKLKG